jgi:hypothetical protein
MLRSIADVLGVDIAIPDHTTLSRRGGGLTILPKAGRPRRAAASSRRQHRPEDLRRGRMAGSKTRLQVAPSVAEAASRR